MKKRNAHNRPYAPVLHAVMLFFVVVQSAEAQFVPEPSTAKQDSTSPRLVVRKAGEPAGLIYDYGKARFLVDSADTQGTWPLVELTEQLGYKMPLHQYDTWDESFYVLEGTLNC